ncbi:MAG: NADAR family protein [Roseiflexaceae bacterium]
MPILFYSANDNYGCFSNFSSHGLQLKGKWWPTSEHYFQAQKFPGTEHEEAIRLAKTPNQAARMGRERNRPLRRDWEQVKDGVMLDALRAKFRTHDDIRQILLDTGDEELIENAPNDYYWGIGADGSGKNMLGKLLMQLRDELRAEA